MATNFTFLKDEWQTVYDSAVKAEKNVSSDPRTACFYARRTLEIAVEWMYEFDEYLQIPYDTSLYGLTSEETFKENLPNAVFLKVGFVRKAANKAVHEKGKVSEQTALQVVGELFHVLYWFARSYTQNEPGIFDGLQFDKNLIPNDQVSVSATSFAELKKIAEEYEKQKAAEELRKKALLTEPTIDEKNKELRKQIAKAKRENQKYPDSHNYSEAETRKHIIDLMLTEAGWELGKDAAFEYEVAGMPNTQDRGFVDYVLWGKDGKSLGLVEAKRTSKGAEAGKQQAKLYADCLEKEFNQRPIIFYSNGYETHLWDDVNYPPRPVQGFYTKDKLELLIQRRETLQQLQENDINADIAGRHYQKRAITKIAESFENDKRRKSLLVMATGAGKTRTIIALCDLLQHANWIKRTLFLADRNALVKQACNAFKEHLPDSNPVNLVTDRKASGSRVYVCTYPTMMNLINEMEDDQRRFSIGHFDLVIIDEAHRSVYKKYQAIFDYFDSYLIGLTATPKSEVDRNTYRLFELKDGEPTDAYELDDAVREKYLVPSVKFSMPTGFTREGIKYSDLSEEEKDAWDEIEWNEEGDTPDEITSAAINRWLFNQDTIEKVLQNLMENGLKVENGDKLGKTIIFAKNHKHAVEIERVFNLNYPHLKGSFARVIDNYESYAHTLLDDFSTPEKFPQIAISVDMLDTGIDIPEIVNLVFFKTVRSKTKFLQMIGRGTRLSPDLYGIGKNKDCFYIFDHCLNFEFFGDEVKEVEPRLQESLSTKIFNKRVELLDSIRRSTLKNEELSKVSEEVEERLQMQVQAINKDNFVVRPHLREVEKFSDQKAWEKLDEDAFYELTQIIASLPNELNPEDETAKQFDFLMLKLQLATLHNDKFFVKLRDQVVELAERLEEKENIPQVKEQIELIQEIQKTDFWINVTVPILETIRKRLRDLIKFIDKTKRKDIYTDFEDELDYAMEVEVAGLASGLDERKYKQKFMAFLQKHENHVTLQKLKTNKPITDADISELERLLFDSDELGTKEEFEKVFGEQKSLGLFIRSLVGLDQAEAKRAFNDFLNGQKYNSNQIEFVNMIIDYLTKNGVMKAENLYEAPYTTHSSSGLSGVFPNEDAKQIVGIINEINQNAAA
ncbi:MAG: DEAD/DEAH box helicase family protein [Aridibacter sp.]